MAVRFRFEVDGVPEFDRTFNRIADNISDLRNIWPDVQRTFLEIESDQFQSGGARGASGAWEQLAPSTQALKGALGGFILVDTGTLRASLGRLGAEGQIYEPAAMELALGTSVPYAGYHQRGTGRMPARPVIDLSEESKRRIQKSIQRGLVDYVRRAGFTQVEVGEV